MEAAGPEPSGPPGRGGPARVRTHVRARHRPGAVRCGYGVVGAPAGGPGRGRRRAAHRPSLDVPAGWRPSRPTCGRCWPSTGRRWWRWSGSCSRSTPAPPSRWPRRRAWPWSRRSRPGARSSSTRPTRSSRRWPATAAPARTRSSAWSRPCWASTPLRPVDAADAVALALCHLAHAPLRRQVARRRWRPGPWGGAVIALRGRLLHRGAGEVLVEVGGIGYVVVVSPTTAVGLGEVGDEAFVWVHHHVRGRRGPLRLHHPRRAGHLRGPARRPRRAGAGARHPLGARRRPWCGSWPRTTSPRCAWSPGWQEDGGPAAGRAQVRGCTCPRAARCP